MFQGILDIVLGITFFCLLFLAVKTRGHVKKYVIGAVLLGLIAILSNSPIENFFYSFSSPAEVAAYACPGEVLGIVDGESSSLIVYERSPGTIRFMLPPKVAEGYKLQGRRDVKATTGFAGSYSIAIIGNRKCSDQYLIISGFSLGSSISIQDNQGTLFTVHREDTVDSPAVFSAFAPLDAQSLHPYEIMITDGAETTAVELERQEDGSYTLVD